LHCGRAGDDAGVTAAISLVAGLGRLDTLHSHAGISVAGRLTVRAHSVAARAAMPHIQLQRKGSIILTASNSGVQHDPGMIAYCTTKHAVVTLTRQIALDCAGLRWIAQDCAGLRWIALDYATDNIRCNALCPGFVDNARGTYPGPS